MSKKSSRRAAVVVGAVALWSIAGMGIADAQPDLTPLINTTCSYSQLMAALNAEAPDLAKELQAYPQAQARLQKFLSLPVSQRQVVAQQALANPQLQATLEGKAGTPEGQQEAQLLLQVANTCGNY